MALKRNSAEGYTNGTGVTLSTSAGVSGDAITVAGTAGVYTASNAHPAHGSMGYKATLASGNTGLLTYQGYNATSVAASFSVYFPSIPTVDENILSFFNTTPSTVVRLDLTAAGKIKLYTFGSVSTWTSTAVLSTNTFYRIEMWATVATSTTGVVHVAIYAGDSAMAITNGTYDATDRNLGTVNMTNVQFGRAYVTASSYVYYMDDLSADDGRTSFIGPWPSNIVPMAEAGIDQTNVEPWSMVTLDGSSSSDTDGTIVAYSWTQTSGTTVSLSGGDVIKTFIAPASIGGETLVFSLEVTDDDGAVSTADSISIEVLPVTERAVIGGAEVPLRIQILEDGTFA